MARKKSTVTHPPKIDMEVHHHPEIPHGEKKSFKEYLLEFLMIFLAVTLGFIAENVRESFSDSSKESEYVTGMIKDLGVDTIRLKITMNQVKTQLNGIDSIRKISKNNLSQLPVQDSLMVITNKYLFYANNFRSDDVTLTQLRNAGGYRLIRKQGVPDSIAEYESRIKDLNDEFDDVFKSIYNARDRADQILDLNVDYKYFHQHLSSTPVLIIADKEKIYNYYNGCWEVVIGLNGYWHMMNDHLTFTKNLIAYLKKEYNVE